MGMGMCITMVKRGLLVMCRVVVVPPPTTNLMVIITTMEMVEGVEETEDRIILDSNHITVRRHNNNHNNSAPNRIMETNNLSGHKLLTCRRIRRQMDRIITIMDVAGLMVVGLGADG